MRERDLGKEKARRSAPGFRENGTRNYFLEALAGFASAAGASSFLLI